MGVVKTELLEYLDIMRKRIWLVLVITTVAAIISGVYSIFVTTPVYEAKSSLIIGRTPNNQADNIQYDDILMYQKLVKTYGELAKSRLVAKETIERLNYSMTPEQLQLNLTVTAMGDTQILDIAIKDSDAIKSMELTNMLSKVFVEEVKSMMNTEDVKIMDEAQVPKFPVSPKVSLNIIIAAFLGFITSLGIIFLMEYLDKTIKTENDVAKYLGISLLASVPFFQHRGSTNKYSSIFVNRDPKSPISEIFRSLRTNIKFTSVEKDIKTIVFTSAGPNEGKSTVVANLAVTLCRAGSRVLVLEGDLRNPTVHKKFGLLNFHGLTSALINNKSYAEYLQNSMLKDLDILTCGLKPPNPAEILGSNKMKVFLDAVKKDYDYILIDTPPAVVVTDAALLASICDGVILIVGSGEAIIEGAVKAKDLLLNGKANIIGVVLNKCKNTRLGQYYYHYYYDKNHKQGKKHLKHLKHLRH